MLNNINDTVKVYRNVAPQKSFLSLKIRGSGANTAAFGTQVYAYNGTDVVYAEQYPVKGYMSSMDHRLHLGLGDAESLDSLIVMWPDGKVQRMYDVAANQQLELIYTSEPLTIPNSSVPNSSPFLKQINVPGLDTVSHQENEFNDFNRDRLLYEMYSNEGPPAAVADLNGDGTDDVVLGGSRGKPVRIFLQTSKGQFIQSVPMAFMNDRESEDSELITFDADGDGDLDIFAASGSNEYGYLDFRLKDRLYINDGAGGFNESESFQGINVPAEPTGFACLMDVNRDGLQDIGAGA